MNLNSAFRYSFITTLLRSKAILQKIDLGNTFMSPIFDMRPAIAYQALRREKSFDLAAIIANNLNLPLST